MTEKHLYLGNIDEPENASGGNLSMTYLDPDDIDASWEALQRLIRGDVAEADE